MENFAAAVSAAFLAAVVGCGGSGGASTGPVLDENGDPIGFGADLSGGASTGGDMAMTGGMLEMDSGVPDCPDRDMDGVCDADDPCPEDELDDQDGDGLCDSDDLCPEDAANDSDGDGVCDGVDSCLEGSNKDADGNGYADLCDQVLWEADVFVDLTDVVTPQDLSILQMSVRFTDGLGGRESINLAPDDPYEVSESVDVPEVPSGVSMRLRGVVTFQNDLDPGPINGNDVEPEAYFDTTKWTVRRIVYEATADGRIVDATFQIRGY